MLHNVPPLLFLETLHKHQMVCILQIFEVNGKCSLGQEGNLSGCGCDKRETEKICWVLYCLFIFLFVVYFTMLRVTHAARSNKNIIGE